MPDRHHQFLRVSNDANPQRAGGKGRAAKKRALDYFLLSLSLPEKLAGVINDLSPALYEVFDDDRVDSRKVSAAATAAAVRLVTDIPARWYMTQ